MRLQGIPEHTVASRISFPDSRRLAHPRRRDRGGECRRHPARAARCDWSSMRSTRTRAVVTRGAVPASSRPPATAAAVEATSSSSSRSPRRKARPRSCRATTRARARLWKARHTSHMRSRQIGPGRRHRTTDVCVPVTELAAAVGSRAPSSSGSATRRDPRARRRRQPPRRHATLDPDDARRARAVPTSSSRGSSRTPSPAAEPARASTGSDSARSGRSSGAPDLIPLYARHQAAVRPARDHEPRQGRRRGPPGADRAGPMASPIGGAGRLSMRAYTHKRTYTRARGR